MQSTLFSIQSIKDERIVQARACASVSGRSAQKAFLLYGYEQIRWALQAGILPERIFCTKSEAAQIEGLIPSCEVCLVSEGMLKKISDTRYVTQPIAVCRQLAERPITQGHDLVLVLDRILDHGNLGTIIRTALAFGVNELVLGEMQSDLYIRKCVDASRGAVFRVHAHQFGKTVDAVLALKQAGYQIIATTPYGAGLQSSLTLQPRPTALVIGNETEGIQPEVLRLADARIQIPMQPEIESLNAGVAAGISLYEIKIKAVFAMLIQKIRTTLGREINAAGRTMMAGLNQTLQPVCDCSAEQVIFLMMMACDKRANEVQISHDTALFGDDLAAFLAPLQTHGWLAPEASSGNTWAITPSGEHWLAEIWPLVERAEKRALQGFTEEEVDQFYGFLKRLQENNMDQDKSF